MSGHIYVTGDVHGGYDAHKLSTKKWPEGTKLDREDYLIVTGDMGLVWSCDPDGPKGKEERHWKKWFSEEKPWTTLFVDGNHENHTRLNKLPTEEMFGGIVGKVCDHIYHLKRGQIYTISGSTFFTMGGATSWDKGHRLIDVSWWEAEIPNHKELDDGLSNLQKNGWYIDYVITHTMPREIMGMFGFNPGLKGGERCPVTGYLDHIARNLKFKDWYFGHFHNDLDRGKYHLLYDRVMQIK